MNCVQSKELKEFNCLWRELDGVYHEIAVKAGMSDSAFFILYAIVEMGDGCLQKEISQQYSFSKQTINSSIKNLELKGYVRLMQEGGRDKHIYLTDEGKCLVKDKIYPVMEMENEIFAEMLPEESSEMLRLTKKYIQLFQTRLERRE